jgi:hypothetical protein
VFFAKDGNGLAFNETARTVQPLNHFKRKGWDAWTRWHSVIGIFVIGLLIFLLYPRSDEPVYHSKTVTQWLDNMALFDELRTMGEGGHGYKFPQSPEVVTNDPALRALLALGAKAVPTLEKRLNEPPLPPTVDPIQSVETWTARQWEQIRGAGPGAPPAGSPPPTFASFQQGRMAAAGLAMLALGTNNHAGALRLLEITAASQRTFFALQDFAVANAGLPERHKEIIAGIVAALNDTNTEIQLAACSATLRFHTKQPEWKNKLLELAQGPDGQVSQWALWSLVSADAKDQAIVDLCEMLLFNKTKPQHLRSFAAKGLGMAGDKAEKSLPFLRAVLTEQDIPKDPRLQANARQAIERIEKSVALRNAKGNSTTTGK